MSQLAKPSRDAAGQPSLHLNRPDNSTAGNARPPASGSEACERLDLTLGAGSGPACAGRASQGRARGADAGPAAPPCGAALIQYGLIRQQTVQPHCTTALAHVLAHWRYALGLGVFVPKAERHAHSLRRYRVYRLITVHGSPPASVQDRMDCHSDSHSGAVRQGG